MHTYKEIHFTATKHEKEKEREYQKSRLIKAISYLLISQKVAMFKFHS